jgi:DNA-binding transcriptional ArsR family regulator
MRKSSTKQDEKSKKVTTKRQTSASGGNLEQLAQLLAALADPVRLRIVRSLAESGEVACGAFPIDMPKSSLSHHFRVLREARVIGTRQEGTSSINYLLTEEIEDRFPGIMPSILDNV